MLSLGFILFLSYNASFPYRLNHVSTLYPLLVYDNIELNNNISVVFFFLTNLFTITFFLCFSQHIFPSHFFSKFSEDFFFIFISYFERKILVKNSINFFACISTMFSLFFLISFHDVWIICYFVSFKKRIKCGMVSSEIIDNGKSKGHSIGETVQWYETFFWTNYNLWSSSSWDWFYTLFYFSLS